VSRSVGPTGPSAAALCTNYYYAHYNGSAALEPAKASLCAAEPVHAVRRCDGAQSCTAVCFLLHCQYPPIHEPACNTLPCGVGCHALRNVIPAAYPMPRVDYCVTLILCRVGYQHAVRPHARSTAGTAVHSQLHAVRAVWCGARYTRPSCHRTSDGAIYSAATPSHRSRGSTPILEVWLTD
jgi:hypothetical protein